MTPASFGRLYNLAAQLCADGRDEDGRAVLAAHDALSVFTGSSGELGGDCRPAGAPVHIMVDTETLGMRPGSVVFEIGACVFDWRSGTVTDHFRQVISIASCTHVGLKVDPEAVAFWEGQSAEARAALIEAQQIDGGLPILHALVNFAEYIREHCDANGEQRIWSLGADFDKPMLEAAFDAVGIKVPWNGRAGRCFRTLRGEFPALSVNRVGELHTALGDALTQADFAARALQIKARMGLNVDG